MSSNQISQIIKNLTLAQDELLDLPIEWQEEAAEKDIDTLHTANTIAEVIDFLRDKSKARELSGFSLEENMLSETARKVLTIIKFKPGISHAEIASEVGIKSNYSNNILTALSRAGEVRNGWHPVVPVWKEQADEMAAWAISCGGGVEILFNGMGSAPDCGRWQCIVADGRADKEFYQGYGLTFEGAISKCHSRFHSKVTGYEVLAPINSRVFSRGE